MNKIQLFRVHPRYYIYTLHYSGTVVGAVASWLEYSTPGTRSGPGSGPGDISELTQQDGWKTQDGRMMKKCRVRSGTAQSRATFMIFSPFCRPEY